MSYAIHPEETERTSCGVRRDPVDRSAIAERAERVATRHMRATTREFYEFLDGRFDMPQIGQLFVGTYPEEERAKILAAWLDYVITSGLFVDDIRRGA